MSDLAWLDELLPLLRCPASRQPLRFATLEEKRAAALPEQQPALATAGGRHVYPVTNGIPILLPPESAATPVGEN